MVTPVTPVPEKEQKVKVVKAKAEPKPPRLSKGWTPETWAVKLAEMTVPAIPEGWLGMADIVDKAVDAGIKASRICTAMGGDRCAGPIWDPIFKVVYVGGRKYASPEILTAGFKLLLDPEYHKIVRVGRPKKAVDPATIDPATGKKLKVKAQIDPNKSAVWTPKAGAVPAEPAK
jgi:hypothetical protein